MTDKKVQTPVKENTINPLVAAVAGAVVAGAAVAGAIIMSDKKNQDKVSKVVTDVKDNFNHQKQAMVNKAHKLEDITKNTVNEVKNI